MYFLVDQGAFQNKADKRRFNVAASRAKDQLWLFHSVQLEDLTNEKIHCPPLSQ
jgi:superfamily I DNA and/or RNA helicase